MARSHGNSLPCELREKTDFELLVLFCGGFVLETTTEEITYRVTKVDKKLFFAF